MTTFSKTWNLLEIWVDHSVHSAIVIFVQVTLLLHHFNWWNTNLKSLQVFCCVADGRVEHLRLQSWLRHSNASAVHQTWAANNKQTQTLWKGWCQFGCFCLLNGFQVWNSFCRLGSPKCCCFCCQMNTPKKCAFPVIVCNDKGDFMK